MKHKFDPETETGVLVRTRSDWTRLQPAVLVRVLLDRTIADRFDQLMPAAGIGVMVASDKPLHKFWAELGVRYQTADLTRIRQVQVRFRNQPSTVFTYPADMVLVLLCQCQSVIASRD